MWFYNYDCNLTKREFMDCFLLSSTVALSFKMFLYIADIYI